MAERDALQAAYACRESGNCLLCREAYLDGEDVVAYPCHTATKCPSVFHPWCASKWYDQGAQVACPLCRTGIIPDGMFPEIDLHALDGDGFGALHHACCANRNPKVVEVLLKWGCNLEQKDQPFLERPLHFAALYRHEEHLRILLNAAAQVDATNYQGQSPMEGCLWDSAPEVEGAVVEVEEAELSKAQKRRERHRANRAAAAQRKDLQREKIAREQFLRETAQGFTERQMPLEPTASKCKERKSKPTQKTLLRTSLQRTSSCRGSEMNFVHVQCPFLRVPGILCRLLPEMPCKLWRKVLRTSRAVGAGSLPFWTQTVPIASIAAVTPSVLVQERCHGTMASNGKMRKFPASWLNTGNGLNDSLCLCPRTSPTRMMKYVIFQQIAAIVSKLSEMFGATTSQQACPVPRV